MTWCWLCLTPYADGPDEGAHERSPQGAHERSPRSAPATAAPPDLEPDQRVPVYSRWRAGPNSFGPVVKGAITAALAPFILAGLWLTFRIWVTMGALREDEVPHPGIASLAFAAFVFVVIPGIAIWATWRTSRVE